MLSFQEYLNEEVNLRLDAHLPATEAFLKDATATIKAAGFVPGKKSRASAIDEIRFTHKDDKKKYIVLDWWHGNGTYGDSKAVLTVYTPNGSFNVLDTMDVNYKGREKHGYFTSDEASAEYAKNLTKAKAFIQDAIKS